MYSNQGPQESSGALGLTRSPIDCAEQTKQQVEAHTKTREGYKLINDNMNVALAILDANIISPPVYLQPEVIEDLLRASNSIRKLMLFAQQQSQREDEILDELRSLAKEAASYTKGADDADQANRQNQEREI